MYGIIINVEQIVHKLTVERMTQMEKKMQVPTAEVQWFEVNPQTIDEKLFQESRSDEKQEMVRLLILEAFAELRINPERYGRAYETMLPKKTWGSKQVEDLQKMASKLGDHMANWTELAFEWAQRISNGETWESVCEENTADWYRLVVWKNGDSYKLIGGSIHDFIDCSATSIGKIDMNSKSWTIYCVPMVVRYAK